MQAFTGRVSAIPGFRMLYFVQQFLNGVHSGALYALLAFGYALTNGVVRRTNLAYGAFSPLLGRR